MLNPRILTFAEEINAKAADPRGFELEDIPKIMETNEEDQSLTTTLDKNRTKNESSHTEKMLQMKPKSSARHLELNINNDYRMDSPPNDNQSETSEVMIDIPQNRKKLKMMMKEPCSIRS